MKTLYISDLDGTLLRSDATLSEYTARTVNSLVSKGLLFSYATARSIVTASKVTAGLFARFPVVTYNGAFVIDNATREVLQSHTFTGDETAYLQTVLTDLGIYPLVYADYDGRERFSFFSGHMNAAKEFFLASRPDDIRRNEVQRAEDVYEGTIFYISCMGDEEKLVQLRDILEDDCRFHCIYQKDFYSGEYWLEILPAEATKANAVLQLKESLGCDRIVAFGDGRNDITLFCVADECYAVENAHPELKKLATAVIGPNDEDSVARWLEENAKIPM